MSADQIPELSKISRISKVLLPILYLNFVLFFLLGVTFILFLIFNASANSASELFPNIISHKGIHITLGIIVDGLTIHETLMVGLGVSIITFLVFHGFSNGINLAKCFIRHEVFSGLTVRYVQKVAIAYSAYFLLFVIGKIVMISSLLGWQAIEIFDPLNSSLMLGMVWLFVWIMQVGNALYSENKMTI